MKNTRVKFKRDILEARFSTARAARLTRLSTRQLDYWDRRGFLTPSLARADGYGSARRYSFVDLVRLRVAAPQTDKTCKNVPVLFLPVILI